MSFKKTLFEPIQVRSNTAIFDRPIPIHATDTLFFLDLIMPWISGPDPHLHRLYVAFGYHRVSSRLRGETWALPWETWRDIWLPHWQRRGRTRDSLCLARIDMDGPWTQDNVHLLTRSEHSRLIRKHYQ